MIQKVDPSDLVADSGVDMPDMICPTCECLVVDGFCNCNYKKEAKLPEPPPQAKAKVVTREETIEEAPKPVPVPLPQVSSQNQPLSFKEMLSDLNNAPSQEQIDAWKSQYGSVYLMPFDKKEMYVIRPLNYREMEMLKANERLQEMPNKFQEQIVLKGVLWPRFSPERLNLSRAGTIPTLFEIIMRASWFVPIDAAVQMTEEL